MSCWHVLPSFLVHFCVLLCMSLKKGTFFGAMVIHSGPLSGGDMDWHLSSCNMDCPLSSCKGGWFRSCQVMYCQLPPSVSPLFSVRRQDVWPKHTHSEAQRGHQPVENLPDPDGA